MLARTFTPFPILTTERLTLRQPAISDDQQIFKLRSDNEVNKYLDREPSVTIDDARNFINSVNEHTNRSASIYWAMTLNNSSTLIGTICLYNFSDDGTCEIGYELLTNFQGQGIMKETTERVIDYALNTLQVQRIEASLHRGNQRSVKLLERLSFTISNEFSPNEPELRFYYLTNSMKRK